MMPDRASMERLLTRQSVYTSPTHPITMRARTSPSVCRSMRGLARPPMAAVLASWLEGPAPRRFLERTPLGVPIAAAAVALALTLGAWFGVVGTDLAWTLGGLAFLFAEMFALYAWIAWRRVRHRGLE
jgi:hypothetical protein